jgi:hypothetical protein
MEKVAFYCASDSSHVPGLVALLNSLRLHGHEEELVVLDAGLSDSDRAVLRSHASVETAIAGIAPIFRKYALPRRKAEVHVILDADLILTRSLDPLFELARRPAIVAFADDLVDRFHPDWSRLLDLGQLESRPYVNAGILVVPAAELGVIERTLSHAMAVAPSQTLVGGASADSPFLYGDQDVLNPILAARPSLHLTVLPYRLAPHPPFRGVEIVDELSVRCRYSDGSEPYALHHVLAKPWLEPTRSNVYTRLLRRVLLADDVQLRVAADQLPHRLRDGHVSALARFYANTAAIARAQRRRVAIRSRLRDRRRGRAGRRAEIADEIS